MASCECGFLKRLWDDVDDCEGEEKICPCEYNFPHVLQNIIQIAPLFTVPPTADDG